MTGKPAKYFHNKILSQIGFFLTFIYGLIVFVLADAHHEKNTLNKTTALKIYGKSLHQQAVGQIQAGIRFNQQAILKTMLSPFDQRKEAIESVAKNYSDFIYTDFKIFTNDSNSESLTEVVNFNLNKHSNGSKDHIIRSMLEGLPKSQEALTILSIQEKDGFLVSVFPNIDKNLITIGVLAFNTELFIKSISFNSDISIALVYNDEIVANSNQRYFLKIIKNPLFIRHIENIKYDNDLNQFNLGKNSYIEIYQEIHTGLKLGLYLNANTPEFKSALTNTLRISLFWFLLSLGIVVFFLHFQLVRINHTIDETTMILDQISKGKFNKRIKVNHKDNIGQLAAQTNRLSSNVYHMIKASISKVESRKNHELHQMVYQYLLPSLKVQGESLKTWSYHQPSPKYKGDFWGCLAIKDNKYIIYIGDSMGEGLLPFHANSIAKATISSFIRDLQTNFNKTSPACILQEVNSLLCQEFHSKLQMTCFIGMVDFSNNEIRYSNSGHNFPIIIPSPKDPENTNRSFSKLHQIHSVTLSQKSNPLGYDQEAVFVNNSFPIKPNDRIVLYTDGLLHHRIQHGKKFTRKRLGEILTQLKLENFSATSSHLKLVLQQSIMSLYLKDDVTVVLIELAKEFKEKKSNADNPMLPKIMHQKIAPKGALSTQLSTKTKHKTKVKFTIKKQ